MAERTSPPRARRTPSTPTSSDSLDRSYLPVPARRLAGLAGGQEDVRRRLHALRRRLQRPASPHALRLTVLVAVVAVVINTVFGVGISLLLVRYRVPGQAGPQRPDRPSAVGLSGGGRAVARPRLRRPRRLVRAGARGRRLPGHLRHAGHHHGHRLRLPAARDPRGRARLEEIGIDQEQAARSLGANAVQTFRRITLPAIRWAVVYGVVLSLARSLGEFGAVKVVSGNVGGKTRTATLAVEQKYQNFGQDARLRARLPAGASVVCIVVVAIVRPSDSP